MKRSAVIYSLLIVVFVLFAGCPNTAGGDDEKGSITITIGNVVDGTNAARAAAWPPTVENGLVGELLHTITLSSTGQKDVVFRDKKIGDTISASLEPGKWRIEVEATVAGLLYATGDNEVTVVAGPNPSVTIDMKQEDSLKGVFFVATADEWIDAADAISEPGEYAIIVKGDFALPGYETSNTFGDATGVTVGIRGNGHTISLDETSINSLLCIGPNQTVIMGGLKLAGTNESVSAPLVLISGTGSAFTMNSGEISGNLVDQQGGGVYVRNGTFTMNGGKISGNSVVNGGGVYISSIGSSSTTFTMNGGEISGNTACYGSGVFITGGNATFTMTGGTISNNVLYTASTSSSDFGGGGLYITGGATFNMTGGMISGSTVDADSASPANGGGVYVNGANSSFTMTGGEISHNTVDQSGGGVYVRDGAFTMSGNAKVTLNEAASGGGVYIANGGEFTMEDGEVSGNTSANNGGGVWVMDSASTFIMNGGTVSGNTANNGGGVVVLNGTFYMQGGAISGNKAVVSGGGVYSYHSGSTFLIVTGTIYGSNASPAALRNTATDGSAALYTSGTAQYGTFDTDGEWVPAANDAEGVLDTTDDTIWVVDGELK